MDTVFIPQTITVHLGDPSDSSAPNVTVPFINYVANVASSEIYPTWPEAAIRANIYVIITYALNRIYTEWYRSKGYDFDITNTTQYDQAYVEGRNIYDNIRNITEEIFDSYVVKRGTIQPFFTAFCNGTTTTCAGLSQWGTVDLAEKGLIPYEILQYYYGDDIDIKTNVPVKTTGESYPGAPLKIGSTGNDVKLIQVKLNRIAQNYPLIPKTYPVDGIFQVDTREAVRVFQRVFNLNQTGEVDKATWYRINNIYNGVKKLGELSSEGVQYEEVSQIFPEEIKQGDENIYVRIIQYFLQVISSFYVAVPSVTSTGIFDQQTVDAVKAFQRIYGLPQTGVINETTWNEIIRAYNGIINSLPEDLGIAVKLFPGTTLVEGSRGDDVKTMQSYLNFISNTYTSIPKVDETGYFGPMTKATVLAFQKQFGLEQTGIIGALTWDKIASVYSDLKYGTIIRPGRY